MKKSFILSGIAVLVFAVSGCSKKHNQEASAPFEYEEAMEDMNSALSNEVAPQEATGQAQTDPNNMVAMTSATPVDPSGPYVKPTHQEVQQSLKNAGFYTGTVDGAIGPRTKKAIRDFQAKNNLNADGRIGPQTWAKLAPYLQPAPAAAVAAPAAAETPSSTND